MKMENIKLKEENKKVAKEKTDDLLTLLQNVCICMLDSEYVRSYSYIIYTYTVVF